MENVKRKFDLSTDKLKNNGENLENEFKSSNICGPSVSQVSDCISNSIKKSKYFEDIKLVDQDRQEKKKKSSKLSVLDPYCKTNILDESDDFIHCESTHKFKNSKNESVTKSIKSEIIACEICKEDITNLDVYSRAVHVNNCIDKQIVIPPEPEIQASETENAFILECPLCFKHFPSPELRANHIKKCGKSKGLSVQSIIKALELQERHALERISLGLPAKPVKPIKSHKNTVNKRPIAEPKNKAQSDIQLAKALSLSLANSSKQNEEENNINVTLVNLKPPNSHQHPGKKPKKIVSTPMLVLRTEEERKKLLLDKVASIVAPQSSCEDDSLVATESGSSKNEDVNNCELPLLWQLSGKALEKHEYYVETLLDWIQPSDVEVGAKLFHLSQIAGHEIVTQLPCDYSFGSQRTQEKNFGETSENFPSAPSLIGSLRSLLASSWMSDVDIHTACGTVIPAHRLLLAVRCPPLKQDSDFCSKTERVSLKWEHTSFNVALQFLNFIYTGNVEIEDNMKSDMLYLANKYEVSDLQDLLLVNQQMDMQSNIESSEKVSDEFGYKDTSSPLLPRPQTQSLESENSTPSETQDSNMDLEIVYNCINSSLKPSQTFMNEPSNLLPATSPQPESRTNSVHSSNINCDGYISFAESSQQCCISNCALPTHRSTSPVIFDVSDSESEKEMDVDSDNESVELPVNCSQKSVFQECSLDSDKDSVELPVNCSQNSILQECNLDDKELDLYSTEGNSSQDSVKFLESSFPGHDGLSRTPVKEKSACLSSSPRFPTNLLGRESPSAVSGMSRGVHNSDAKRCIQETDAIQFKEFPSDEYANLESPVSSHIKCSPTKYEGKIQANDEISTVDSSDKNSNINQIYRSEVAEKVNISHLSGISTNFNHDITQEFDGDFGGDITAIKGFSANESSVLSTPEKFRCLGKASPLSIASSPEVLICDSDCDIKSPMSIPCERFATYHEADDISQCQIKPKFCNDVLSEKSPKISSSFQEKRNFFEKSSENEDTFLFLPSSTSNIPSNFISSVPLERKSDMSPEARCSTEDDAPSNSERFSFLGNEKYEFKEKFSFTILPNEELGSSKQVNSPRFSQISYEPSDDPQHEYFNYDVLSSPNPEVSELHSPRKSKYTKDNQISPRFSQIPYKPSDDPLHEYFKHDVLSSPKPEIPELHSPRKSKFTKDNQSSPRFSQIPYKPSDDPLHEYFKHDVLASPKPEVPELHSPRKSKFTKDNQVTKSDTPSSSTQPKFQMTDSPVTPFPDYKNMVTPEIKQALRKIGVKALPRKKAVAILSHVYNETHPLINGEINAECSPEKTSKTEKLKKRKKVDKGIAKRAKKQQTEVQCAENIGETQGSDDSGAENPEWQGCVPEITFSQLTQDSPTKSSKDDIELIKQYIHSNEELYSNILTYSPLNLVALHQELKDNGMKISIPKLMDFLDEQCITFTCPRKEEYRKKQTARAQRFRKNMIAKFSQQPS